MITLRPDKAKLAKTRRALGKIERDLPKAAARALNRTLTMMRADIVREVRREVNIPAKVIRGSITLNRATARDLEAVAVSSGRPLPLIYFGARPNKPVGQGGRRPKTGVSVKVKKSRKVIRGAFIARVKGGGWSKFEGFKRRGGGSRGMADFHSESRSGGGVSSPLTGAQSHAGIFLRGKKQVKPGAQSGLPRNPIHQLYGPRAQDILSNQPVLDRIKARASENLARRIDHEVDRLMKKAIGA